MLKVGSAIVDEKTEKKRKISYQDVEYDSNKWVDATKFLPEDFDLLYLKIKHKDKIFTGWVNGKKWDGLRIDKQEEVLYWKRKI